MVRVQQKSTRRTTGVADHPPSCAMVLTVSFVLSPATIPFVTVIRGLKGFTRPVGDKTSAD